MTSQRIDLLAAAVLVCCVGAYSALYPVVSFDSWAYHFPFSTYLFDIGGGRSAFNVCKVISDRFDGFPLLSEFAQGLFWKVTGTVRSVVIPQLVALLLLLYVAQRRLGISSLLLLASFGMVPLLLIHTVSTNNDLLSGILIACGLIFGAEMVADTRDISSLRWITLISLFAAASATKYQSVLFTSAIFAVFIAAIVIQRRFRARYLVWVIVAVVAINAFEIRNFIRYNNPFYPVEVKAGGKIIFKGPETAYSQMPTYEPRSGPAYFIASITEHDWVKRGVVPRYSYAMEEGDLSRMFGSARTGGFGQAYVLVTLSLLIFQAILWKAIDRRQRTLLSTCAALLALTAIMPQALELRYWLYVPIFLNITTLRFVQQFGLTKSKMFLLMAPLLALSFANSFNGIWPGRYQFSPPPSEYMNTGASPKQIEYPYPEFTVFRYSLAITGQNLNMSCKEN